MVLPLGATLQMPQVFRKHGDIMLAARTPTRAADYELNAQFTPIIHLKLFSETTCHRARQTSTSSDSTFIRV